MLPRNLGWATVGAFAHGVTGSRGTTTAYPRLANSSTKATPARKESLARGLAFGYLTCLASLSASSPDSTYGPLVCILHLVVRVMPSEALACAPARVSALPHGRVSQPDKPNALKTLPRCVRWGGRALLRLLSLAICLWPTGTAKRHTIRNASVSAFHAAPQEHPTTSARKVKGAVATPPGGILKAQSCYGPRAFSRKPLCTFRGSCQAVHKTVHMQSHY